MPFPMLFAAISNKVPLKDMQLVDTQYELFRVGSLTQISVYFYSLRFLLISDACVLYFGILSEEEDKSG